MKILLTTSMSHFKADYFCTVCSYVPKAGNTMYVNINARCPKCGSSFPKNATNRFKSCSIDFAKIPNQKYPKEYTPFRKELND